MLATPGARIGRTLTAARRALLLILAMAALPPVASTDLYSASSEYKNGDYAHALPDFLALAKLGQPVAQLNVAAMYRNGQGAEQSDIHAYAWAMLAAQNGDAQANRMADRIRPELAPGSEQIAGWITAPYTPAALSQRLMPNRRFATWAAAAEFQKCLRECHPAIAYKWVYPEDARAKGVEGDVFVAFTLMPDGRARMPRVILDVPQGVFAAATRESVLRDTFAPLPAGSTPVHCVIFQRYVVDAWQDPSEYPHLMPYVDQVRKLATGGDPNSQLLYGMLLVGLPQLEKSSNAALPWFVQAAQAGLPLAQFEIGFDLLRGLACQADEAKAIRWLRMAADQNEPNAEVTLAIGAMKGSPEFGDAGEAKSWLEKASAQGNHDGELYLSALLAAAPDPHLRDPQRALELLQRAFDHVGYDPTEFEIRAAAQAAEGDFSDAIKSEKRARATRIRCAGTLRPCRRNLLRTRRANPGTEICSISEVRGRRALSDSGRMLDRKPRQRHEAFLVGALRHGLQ